MCGVKKWSNGAVEAKRVCAATRAILCARSKTKQPRNATTQDEGNGERSSDGHAQTPRHASSRSVGTDAQGKPASSVSGSSADGVRPARGRITSSVARPARNSVPLCNASPRGAKRIGISGCPYASRGCTPNSAGTTMTTESTGMPPACKSASTRPDGFCCSGSPGVAHATVTPGKATTKCWSACTLPDHGS